MSTGHAVQAQTCARIVRAISNRFAIRARSSASVSIHGSRPLRQGARSHKQEFKAFVNTLSTELGHAKAGALMGFAVVFLLRDFQLSKARLTLSTSNTSSRSTHAIRP